MQITQITVSYGETQSLPEYSNVKPLLSITATLDEGEDVAIVEAQLWEHAKDAVHAQIDAALEANDKAAKYSTEPRYQVMQTYWNEWDHPGQEKPPQYVIILPNTINHDRDAYAQRLVHAGNSSGDARKLRYDHALRIAAEVMQERGYTLLDCSSGDLTPLNLAIGAPESNPEGSPARLHPINAAPDGVDEEWEDDADDEDDEDEDDEEEEARDFVAERHARLMNKQPDDPDQEH